MAHVRPADRHKCKMVAEQLHAKLLKLYPQNPAWYKLFSQMDNDGSGRITYDEMAEMIRRGLELPLEKLSEGTNPNPNPDPNPNPHPNPNIHPHPHPHPNPHPNPNPNPILVLILTLTLTLTLSSS